MPLLEQLKNEKKKSVREDIRAKRVSSHIFLRPPNLSIFDQDFWDVFMGMQNGIWKLIIMFLSVNLPSERLMALPGTKKEGRDRK